MITVQLVDQQSKTACLKWLQQLDQSSLHEEIRKKATHGTGKWFLEGSLCWWKSENSSFLWLQGKGSSLLEYY